MRDDATMSMILSHSTAQLYHRLQNRPILAASLPVESTELRPGAVDTQLAERARQLLLAYGAPPSEVEKLDVMVRRDCDRRSGRGVNAHVWRSPLPPNSLIKLEQGIYVTDVPLTVQQIARQSDEKALVEYLMELCGKYTLPPDGGDFAVRPPLMTLDEVKVWTKLVEGQHGANKLRRALPLVRAGARSPMETAFFMMMLMPKRLGGLGMGDLELAHRIDVMGEARALTRRFYFECDAFSTSLLIDFEYNGILHELEKQLEIDVERVNALEAMGYSVMVITRHAFFDREAFLRLMRAIERRAGWRYDRVPSGFIDKQEELRKFVLRRHLD